MLTIKWLLKWTSIKQYWRVHLKEKVQNCRDIHLKMDKIENGYGNVKNAYFYVFRTTLLDLCFLHDLGVEVLIFIFSSSDLYFIVKSKMAVILHIYN